MNSILEEFAYGNINPNDQGFKKNSTFGRALQLLTKNEENLLSRLKDDDRMIFEKYIDAQGEINRVTAVSNFIYGYRLGLTMTPEAFSGMGSLISGEED